MNIINKTIDDFNVIAINDVRHNPEKVQEARGRSILLLESAVLILVTPAGLLAAALLSEALMFIIPIVCFVFGLIFGSIYLSNVCTAIEDDKQNKLLLQFYNEYFDL